MPRSLRLAGLLLSLGALPTLALGQSTTSNYNYNTVSTGSSTNTNNNVNTSTSDSTSTNTNTNYNVNSGEMTNRNINTSTSSATNVNVNTDTSTSVSTITSDQNIRQSSTSSSTATNNNNNVNVNTSTSESRSVSSSDSTQAINQKISSPPPSAIAPSIMSYSQDLCTTGQSGAVQTQILGISAGRTVRDQNCERMKLSKTLYDMGMKVAAVSLLCQDDRVFRAMEMAGTPCPFMGEIGAAATTAWSENPDKRPDAKKRDR